MGAIEGHKQGVGRNDHATQEEELEHIGIIWASGA